MGRSPQTPAQPPAPSVGRGRPRQAPFRIPPQPTERDLLAKYFRAFGDPTRLQILEVLRDGELSVGEIVARIGTSQPRASSHLGCLRWCGLVKARRQQTTVHYSLADDRVAELVDLARSLLAAVGQGVGLCPTVNAAADASRR